MNNTHEAQMTTYQEYEIAQAKLEEYTTRKKALIDTALMSLPVEMDSLDKQIVVNALHDGLSDAYRDLIKACNAIIREYGISDGLAYIGEHSTLN